MSTIRNSFFNVVVVVVVVATVVSSVVSLPTIDATTSTTQHTCGMRHFASSTLAESEFPWAVKLTIQVKTWATWLPGTWTIDLSLERPFTAQRASLHENFFSDECVTETWYLTDKAAPLAPHGLYWVPVQQAQPACTSLMPVSSATLCQFY